MFQRISAAFLFPWAASSSPSTPDHFNAQFNAAVAQTLLVNTGFHAVQNHFRVDEA
jgi:hypothetical protein